MKFAPVFPRSSSKVPRTNARCHSLASILLSKQSKKESFCVFGNSGKTILRGISQCNLQILILKKNLLQFACHAFRTTLNLVKALRNILSLFLLFLSLRKKKERCEERSFEYRDAGNSTDAKQRDWMLSTFYLKETLQRVEEHL